MNHLYHLLHLIFENTMGGGIGYHKCGQLILMVLCRLREAIQVNVSPLITIYNHNLHTGHYGTGRIGPMRRGRDQYNIPVSFAATHVPCPDHHESGKFSRGARIGHQ